MFSIHPRIDLFKNWMLIIPIIINSLGSTFVIDQPILAGIVPSLQNMPPPPPPPPSHTSHSLWFIWRDLVGKPVMVRHVLPNQTVNIILILYAAPRQRQAAFTKITIGTEFSLLTTIRAQFVQ